MTTINQQPFHSRKRAVDELFIGENVSDAELVLSMNDASIDQILALNVSLKIIAWNRACEEATGVAKEDAIGKMFSEIWPDIVEFPKTMEALVLALKGIKSFVSWEHSAYRPGYLEHHFIPLKSPEGVTGVMVVIHDVAHRIKAEEELRRLNQELMRKARELRDKTAELISFNWIASHDLKEPLRKIYTFIEMVATKEGPRLSDAGRGNLRRAQSAVQRMGLLTDDIVTFTQVSAPSESLADVSLEDLMRATLAAFDRQIREIGAVIVHDPLPEVLGYKQMLGLLLHHMIGNGLKFRRDDEAPKLHVAYHLCSGAAVNHEAAEIEADYHCITFRDNGIGIAPNHFEKVFGMFQRLHPHAMYRGTGMGLPICRKVVEAHDGFIVLESAEGQGSIFRCYLKVDFDIEPSR
jgi:PAS domain S-box-containing protein